MEDKKIIANNYNVYIDEAGDEGFKFECDSGRVAVNSLFYLQ